MPLTDCENNFILIGITNSTGVGTFVITDTKLYVPVTILSTQDNAKLLQQLKSGLKRTTNCNKNK